MVYCFHYHYRLPSETTGRSDEPIRSTPLDKAMKKTPEKKMTKPKRPASAQRIRRILILSYLVITLVAVAASSIPVLLLSSKALKNKVTSLLYTYTSQIVQNSDTYLSDYESQALLLFADSSALQYDPDDTSLSQETRNATENRLKNTLQRIRVMKNYGDLFLVSPANHLIGSPSLYTQTTYGTMLYSTFHDALIESGGESVWLPVLGKDNSRIYYVRELNPQLLLITSVYAMDFTNVFVTPVDFSDICVRLISQDHTVIYSTTSDDIGQPLPEEIEKRLGEHPNSAFFSQDYLISEAESSHGFTVVCSVAAKEILSDVYDLRLLTLTIAGVTLFLAVLISFLLSRQITKPLAVVMDNLHQRAEYDLLTNLLDKKTFEEHVDRYLSSCGPEMSCSYLQIDLDNFKNINDTCGHAVGDEVLASVGALLNSTFRKDDIKGRIGGDEFAVLLCAEGKSPEKLCEITHESCIRLFSSMKYLSTTIAQKTGTKDVTVSASVGIAILGCDGNTFQELYQCADKALYVSKRSGKNRFTFYESV